MTERPAASESETPSIPAMGKGIHSGVDASASIEDLTGEPIRGFQRCHMGAMGIDANRRSWNSVRDGLQCFRGSDGIICPAMQRVGQFQLASSKSESGRFAMAS